MGVLAREWETGYEACLKGLEPNWEPLPITYLDYASWQANRPAELLEEQINWWVKELADPPVLNLPIDKQRPANQTFTGAEWQFSGTPALAQNLNERCREEGVTPFMFTLAAFQVLLGR